jgi:hypothetical protein
MWDVVCRIRELLGIIVGACLFAVLLPVLLIVLAIGCAGLAVVLGTGLVCVVIALLLIFPDKTIQDIRAFTTKGRKNDIGSALSISKNHATNGSASPGAEN